MRTEPSSIRVAVVDPSLFSLPYDLNLCEGLGLAGVDATLYGRMARTGEVIAEKGFRFRPWFYRYSEQWRKRLPKKVGSLLKGLEHYLDMLRFVRHVRAEHYSAVHFQWMAVPLIDRRMIQRLKGAGIPVVMTVHDTIPFNDAPTSQGQNVGWKSTLELFDAIVVHTQMSKQQLEGMGIRVPVQVIAHGLLQFGAPQAEAKSERLRLLFFGAIKPYKGLDILLRAFRQANENNNLELRIVGNCHEGPQEIAALIRVLGLGNSVRFECRFFADQEIPGMMAQADVVVFPYRRIDGSGALLTALAYRKPVIATDVGMFRELIVDREALVAPDSVEELARKLRQLSLDPNVIQRLRFIGLETAAKIPDWAAIGAQTRDLYCRLL